MKQLTTKVIMSSMPERLMKLEVKMESVCRKTDELDKKLDDILTNHLPGIKQDLAVAKLKLTFIVGIVTFVATFLASKLFEILR